MKLNGRTIKNAEVDGVEGDDNPDFCDAFFSYAEYEDGTPLDDDELEGLTYNYPEVINEAALENMTGWADDAYDRMMDR